jgi:hypothetical protein
VALNHTLSPLKLAHGWSNRTPFGVLVPSDSIQ